jgi:hypothetical protein
VIAARSVLEVPSMRFGNLAGVPGRQIRPDQVAEFADGLQSPLCRGRNDFMDQNFIALRLMLWTHGFSPFKPSYPTR